MAILVKCDCGKGLKIPTHLAGKRLLCPGCKKPFRAPAAKSDQPGPAALEAKADSQAGPTAESALASIPEPEEADILPASLDLDGAGETARLDSEISSKPALQPSALPAAVPPPTEPIPVAVDPEPASSTFKSDDPNVPPVSEPATLGPGLDEGPQPSGPIPVEISLEPLPADLDLAAARAPSPTARADVGGGVKGHFGRNESPAYKPAGRAHRTDAEPRPFFMFLSSLPLGGITIALVIAFLLIVGTRVLILFLQSQDDALVRDQEKIVEARRAEYEAECRLQQAQPWNNELHRQVNSAGSRLAEAEGLLFQMNRYSALVDPSRLNHYCVGLALALLLTIGLRIVMARHIRALESSDAPS